MLLKYFLFRDVFKSIFHNQIIEVKATKNKIKKMIEVKRLLSSIKEKIDF
jgi:hypothetical protein